MAVISRGEITISNVNDGLSSFTHQGYSWSADGKDRFTTSYPNENLFPGSKATLTEVTWPGYEYGMVLIDLTKINYNQGDRIFYSYYADNTKGTALLTATVFFYDSSGALIATSALRKNVEVGAKGYAESDIIIPANAVSMRVPKIRKNASGSGTASYSQNKLELLSKTIYTPMPSEDFVNAYPTYIGNYIDSNETDSQNPSDYTWRPATGKDGLGIASVSSKWQLTSTLTAPTQTWDNAVWLTSQPTTTETSRWLWQIDRTTYTNGTTSDQITLKAVQGQATSYWVSPSVNVVKRSATGTITPTSVTFNSYSKIGTANSELYAGRFIISTSTDGTTYTTKYTSSANQSTFAYAVPTDAKFIKARLYLAGGTTALLDEQTIPILESAEGLEIGGRNYFKGSDKEITASREFVNNPNWDMAPIFDTYGIDKFYTISFDLKSKVAGNIQIYAQNGAGSKYNIGTASVQATTAYQRFSITFKPTLQANSTETRALLAFYGVYDSGRVPTVKNVMIETGTKASAWVPALEDAQLYTAWSNDPNGKDMVRVYPNENLILDSQTPLNVASANATDNYKYATVFTNLEKSTTYTFSSKVSSPTGYTLPTAITVYVYTSPTVSMESQKVKAYITDNYIQATITTDNRYDNYNLIVYAGQQGSTAGNSVTFIDRKLEKGNKATIYTPSPQDDPVKAEMAYIGYSPKDSNDPTDYKWTENPKVAQISANVANNSIAEMSKDSVLSAVEKNSIAKEWATIQSDYPLVKAQGIKYNISLTTLNSAYSALSAYITPLLALMTINSTIVPATFQATFKNYYDAKLVVLNAINDSLGKSIDDAIKVSKTYTDAQIKISKDAIDLSVIKVTNTVTQVSEDLSNLSIGGTNMITDSTNMLQSKVEFSGATGTKTLVDEAKSPTGKATKIRLSANTSNILFYLANGRNLADPTNKTLLAGEIYTLSMMIRADVAFVANNVSINEASVISHTFTQVTTEYKRVSVTFKPTINSSTATNQNIHFYVNDLVTTVGNDIYIHSLQLEKGNIATSWSPAPEDAKLYTAWSNDPNVANMVRTYPNENLVLGTQFKTVDDWALTWATTNGTKTLTNDGLKLTATTAGQTGMGGGLSRQLVSGEIVTVTFKFRGLGAVEPYFLMKSGANLPIMSLTSKSTTEWQEYSRGYAFPSRTEGISSFSILTRGIDNWIEIQKESVKIEVGNKTIYTPSPQDDPVKAEMAYIGYSPKDSSNPSDYVWIENPKAISLYTAWSNKEDGSEDFARNYPTPNLLFDSKLTNLSNWSVNSYLNGVSNGDGTATLNKTETTTSRSFFSSATRYNPEAKSSTMYSFAIDIKFDSNCTGITGSSVFLRETKNGSNLRDFAAVNLTDSIEKGKWVTYIASGTSSDIDSVQFTLAMANGMLGTFHVRKPKVTFGSTALPFSVMATDDPIKAEMAYIGYSVKDSNNPTDYTWSENPKAKGTFKRWANSPDGTVDFTAVYPNENLLLTTTSESRIVGMGKSNQTDARTNYTLLTTPFNTLWADMKVGDTFTFSCDVNISGTGFAGQFRPQTASTIWLAIGSYYNVTKAETVRVSFTGTVTQELIDSTTVTMIQIRYDNVPTTVAITVSKPKLERGSVATPYTTNREEDLLLQIPQYVGIGSKDTMNPADFVWDINPEYNQSITYTSIKEVELQLSPDNIYAKVAEAPDYIEWKELIDSKPNINDLNNVYDQLEGLSSADETILASMAELEMANNGVLTTITQALEGMDGTLSTITDYMFFGTNGLTIGKSNSTLKVNISNTELAFYDNSTKVAWVDSQRLNIREALIEKKIKVGNHIIEKFDDKEEITIFKYDGI